MNIASASGTCRHKGRPRKLSPEKEAALVKAYELQAMPVANIAAAFGIHRSTVYDALERARQAKEARATKRKSKRVA